MRTLQKFPYESFVTKDVEKAIVSNLSVNSDNEEEVVQHNNMMNQVLQNVDKAFDVIASVFPEKNKIISKVNIPAFVNLLVENNFDDNVIPFIQAYSKSIKKGDPYRKYSAGTKKSDVENKLKGIQALYEQYLSGVIETKSGQTELTMAMADKCLANLDLTGNGRVFYFINNQTRVGYS